MPTTPRTYVSPLRAQAAAQTRERILQSATRLFAEHGYGRVTVANIADEAGVSAKAVFASAGSKSDLLNEIVDTAVRASGHEQAIAAVLAAPDLESAVSALAHGTRAGNESMFSVHEAIHKALPSHEDGEALWERATADYRAALRTAARHLHTLMASDRRGGRRPEEETADLLWFWFGPGGWRTLVVENGWPWDRAEAFLLHTALATLRTP
ncbi:TetR/AcrR family transcriptional regulator [Streptomyces sp. NRRL F-5727]|uniref:TetR/AcrR family transcriptional regulator n=1 Tax=Streptomyces sp. NRRL F-5727 TaxID=1463871 RepID=UPI0004CAFEF6|nr:TetR/AcrR family transcriptional regulator [Streptomyces sp. NRRL F-5727]